MICRTRCPSISRWVLLPCVLAAPAAVQSARRRLSMYLLAIVPSTTCLPRGEKESHGQSSARVAGCNCRPIMLISHFVHNAHEEACVACVVVLMLPSPQDLVLAPAFLHLLQFQSQHQGTNKRLLATVLHMVLRRSGERPMREVANVKGASCLYLQIM